MGWWGVTAMAGDTPSDILCGFQNVLKMGNSFWDRFYDGKTTSKDMKKVAVKINENLDRLITFCEKQENDSYYDDYFISYHVLAIFVMNHGANFPDWLRGKCIECCVDDTWAHEDDERLNAMLSLINDILNYKDGKPTEESTPDRGLFGAIFTALDKGKQGLVNR